MNPSVTKKDSPNGRTRTAAPSNGVPAADVSDAMRELRSRSPQESLGVNAQKGLWTAFLQATVVIAVLFCGWTAMAYFADRNAPAPEKADKKDQKDNTNNNNAPPVQPAEEGVAKKDGPAIPKGKKEIGDVLGETGTKKGNPKFNPLDRKDDDLFKDK